MLITRNFVLFHIPRCGGTWIRETLMNGGLLEPIEDINGHSHIAKNSEGKMKFCFIRHPVSWYPSYWNRRMHLGWTTAVLDSHKSNDFNEFMKKVLKHNKRYYSKMINQYVKECNYIGIFRNLTNDLIHMLTISDSQFDEDYIRNCKPINCSNFETYNAIYKPEVLKDLLDAESEFIERYYKDAEYTTSFTENRENGLLQSNDIGN